jgi:preprotein translocase subunit YajC
METSTIIEIIIAVIVAIAFILFLIRRNVADEQDINPELTDALEDEKKVIKKNNENVNKEK